MTKSDDRRAALLDRLADHVLREGLLASSLRPLAQAAGTSDRMLLYYFKDKSDVIAAVLGHIAARLTLLLDAQTSAVPLPLDRLRAHLWTSLSAEALWPYMRLWLEIAAMSARGDPLLGAVGQAIGRGFLAWGAAQLDCPVEAERERQAAQLLVSIEGMVLLKAIGLDDVNAKVV
jgi:AcrR family transcriptional regulator